MMSSFVKKEKNQPIQVFVRVRPLNKQEGNTNCIEVKNHKELVIRYHGTPRNYSFDRVFGPGSKQMDVYKLVAEPLVREVISGYNCTVLAYGQTGTGKTYTMAGSSLADGRASTSDISWTEDVDSGIIPRTLSHMFDELRLQNAEYTIRVSYLELYNEEIFDLLSPLDDGQTKIKLYDDTMKKGSVIVNGMTEQTVNSKAEVFKILEKGAEKRKVAATLMNAQSSRSHTVFCIMIHTRENTIDGEDLLKTGKLYLVDLAGSENIKQSGATDVRAREAVSINQSLLTLGRCISKLIERSAHIPFRESKLTRLLQDSLGGRTKTTLIATVSPASCNADESMNTLEYASRAKNITNKPEINQRLSKKMLIKDYSDEIERLRKDLVATRQGKGIYLDEDNYESLIKEIEIYKEEVVEKIAMIRILREEMVKKENLCDQLKISITEHKKVVEEKDSTICSLKDELQTVSKVVVHLQDESKLKEYIVEKYEQTEQQLQTTAKELLTVADTSTTDTRKLHDKLDTLANITKQNKQALEQHLGDWNNKMQRVNNGVRSLYDNIYELHEHMEILSSDIQKSSASTRENVENYMKKLLPLKDKIFDIIEEVNLGTNNIKIQTDQTKSKVDSYFDDIKIKFDLIFNNHLIPIMEGIHTIVDNREAHLEDFIRKINDFNNILIKTIGDSNGVFLFHINEIKRDTNRRVEEVLSAYVFLEEKYKQQNDMLKEYECELDRKNEKINQLLESFKELSGNYATHQRSALDSGWEMINTSKQSLIALKNNCRSTAIQTVKSAEGVFKEVVEQKEVYNNGMIEYETKKQNLDDKYSHAKNELKEAIKEAVTESTQHHNELQLNCLAEISHLRDSFITQYEKPSEIIRESNSILPSLHADMGNDVSFMQESTQMLVNKLMKEVTDHKSYCDQSESEISTEIDDCREGMRKLITSSIKEYNSTGETPQRRSYKYPRTLVVTQPKEKLVEEFYSLRVMADIGEKDENDTGSENVGHANGESRIPIPKKITMEKENDVDKDGHKTDPEEKDIG